MFFVYIEEMGINAERSNGAGKENSPDEGWLKKFWKKITGKDRRVNGVKSSGRFSWRVGKYSKTTGLRKVGLKANKSKKDKYGWRWEHVDVFEGHGNDEIVIKQFETHGGKIKVEVEHFGDEIGQKDITKVTYGTGRERTVRPSERRTFRMQGGTSKGTLNVDPTNATFRDHWRVNIYEWRRYKKTE